LGIKSFLKERKIGAANKLAGARINMISLEARPNFRIMIPKMTRIRIKRIK